MIQKFQRRLNALFADYILSVASFTLGASFIEKNPDFSHSVRLANGAFSEPIAGREIIRGKESVGNGVSELFQSKSLVVWSDLLLDIYLHCMNEHLQSGKELSLFTGDKAHKGIFLAEGFELVKDKVERDFSFARYSKRYGKVEALLGLHKFDRLAKLIYKHVELRNSFQHHSGYMHSGGLKNLGLANVVVYGANGEEQVIEEGGQIALSSVEVDVLKSGLFELSSRMEKAIEQYQA